MSQDPIGLLGGENLYVYVDNPTFFIDPFGLCSWNTARKNFWINEAKTNPHKYSARNQALMLKGNAPRFQAEVLVRKTQKIEVRDIPMELHHTYLPQRSGSKKAHECWNLTIANPWAHEAMDYYRHTGTKLEKIIKGVNSW